MVLPLSQTCRVLLVGDIDRGEIVAQLVAKQFEFYGR